KLPAPAVTRADRTTTTRSAAHTPSAAACWSGSRGSRRIRSASRQRRASPHSRAEICARRYAGRSAAASGWPARLSGPRENLCPRFPGAAGSLRSRCALSLDFHIPGILQNVHDDPPVPGAALGRLVARHGLSRTVAVRRELVRVHARLHQVTAYGVSAPLRELHVVGCSSSTVRMALDLY